jgi:hypothetical protein
MAGVGVIEDLHTWAVRWHDAEIDAGGSPATAAADYLARMQKLEDEATKFYNVGVRSEIDVTSAEYFVAEGEYWAAQAAH